MTVASEAAEQFLPELVIVAAGFDRQWHRNTPPQQEYFLLLLETRQHAAQGVPPRKTRKHGMDIVLVPEPARDASPQLRHDLVIDLRRALVDDQERHIIFA